MKIDKLLDKYLTEQAYMYHVKDDVYCVKHNIHQHTFKAGNRKEAMNTANDYVKSITFADVQVVDMNECEEEEE